MSGTRLQALSTKVHSPDRVRKYPDVGAAIEQWLTWLREYEAACGNGGVHHRVPDVAKITALRQLVPKELDLDIGRQANLKAYDEVRAYISEQVVIRRGPYFVGSKKIEQMGATSTASTSNRRSTTPRGPSGGKTSGLLLKAARWARSRRIQRTASATRMSRTPMRTCRRSRSSVSRASITPSRT